MNWNKYFFDHSWLRDDEKESRIHTHGINYSLRDYGGTWPKHAGVWLWLRFPRLVQTLHLEWVFFERAGGASIKFDTTDEEDIKFSIAIPFVVTLYFGVASAKWVLRLLGLEWEQVREKPHRDWSRSLAVSWHSGALWIDPWVSPYEWNRNYRSTFSINPANILLGRRVYSERVDGEFESHLFMPEGAYPLTVKLFTGYWKRPRWPRVESRGMANVLVMTEGGVPIPGKGESAWDLDDDAIFELNCTAATVGDAVAHLRESVERTRRQYGWPESGSADSEATP